MNNLFSKSKSDKPATKRRHVMRALVAAAFLVSTSMLTTVEAKPGGGGSVGSRGSRTFSAPAATPTAPSGATPFARTAAPQPAPAQVRPSGVNPAAAPARPASRFGTGLMAGLLGAGLFGALLGSGFSGGLGGIMSFLGLIVQFALLAMIAGLAIRWFRSRSQPALSMAGAPAGRRPLAGELQPRNDNMAAGSAPSARPVNIEPADYQAFERLLGEVQGAYSQENLNALRSLSTPEMASYFAEELSENNRRGVVNKVSNVKLLQGDLSEAWGERDGEFATVAMRYALTDEVLDRTTGRPTPGSSNGVQEATEYWTFVRPANGNRAENWKLSAIQQAA